MIPPYPWRAGKSLHLRTIKTKRIRDLDEGLVEDSGPVRQGRPPWWGNGFTITYDMLDSLVGDRGGREWRGILGRGR